MSATVRVGLIGTSKFSELVHLPNLKSHPQAETVAICGHRVGSKRRMDHIGDSKMTPVKKKARNRRVAFVCVLLMLFAISECPAVQPYDPVQPDPVLEAWRWTRFPELNGLGLRCLAEAKDGAMWFGVEEGAVRYDGVAWKTYTEKDGIYGAPVNQICTARDGGVYAGTDRGISRFYEGKWTRVFPAGGDLPWHVWDLMEASDGSVWAGTNWGALRLSRAGSVLYTTGDMADALRLLMPDLRLGIVPDEAVPARSWPDGPGLGIVGGRSGSSTWAGWFGSAAVVIWHVVPGASGDVAGLEPGDRIIQIDGESRVTITSASIDGRAGTTARLTVQRTGHPGPFEVMVSREKVEGAIRPFWVYDICEDREGAMWFGLAEGEILQWRMRDAQPGEPAAWRLYAEADGLEIAPRPRMLQARDGTIWTVSEFEGVGVNRIRLAPDASGTGSERMERTNLHTSILETRDGTLWIGGQGTLYALGDGAWRGYGLVGMSLPFHRVRLAEAADGGLWIAGLGQGAARLDIGTARWTTIEGLAFQCETPDGAQWFVSQDSTAVRRIGQTWTRFGAEDGLMEMPWHLFVDSSGQVWAAGGHRGGSATARFDGYRWALQTHPRHARFIPPWGGYVALDGSIWFGAAHVAEEEQRGGVLRFDPQDRAGGWTHYAPPEAPHAYIYGIGQAADGSLYFGGTFGLRRFDGQHWKDISEVGDLGGFVDRIYTSPGGDLWVGTRTSGAFRYDGRAWTRYDMRDGLADDAIGGLLQTSDGTVWIQTREGISRFDGQSWTTHALPALPMRGGFGLFQSREGAVWVNQSSIEGGSRRLWANRYMPDAVPPETEITLSVKEVSQPGNTTLAWKGSDPWKATPDEEIQYAYRLNSGAWSAFSHRTNEIFQALSSGRHTFEVKARDRDFNEDPTPARVAFVVVSPVWQQPWFIAMVVVFVVAVGVQTTRVVRRDQRVREANARLETSNTALSAANHALFDINRKLQAERAVERVRAEVTAMKQADDLRDVVGEMLQELSSAGVDFDLCVINIVDEEAGVRRQYGATKQGWSGQAEMPLREVSEAFMSVYREGKPVVRQVDDALAGRHLEMRRQMGIGVDGVRPTAIVEAPFAYGTLSLSTAKAEGFSEEEVELVGEFARVIALGYARYLDFQKLESANQEIQAQTQRKSAFLASMSHELRTPMNAIMGFTRLVLRREPELTSRGKENLEKVGQASDHLMGLINDILDLSKIEAGKMDVAAKRFDVKHLIRQCVSTVSPLVKEGVALRCEVAEGVGEAFTDEGRVRQMVINLLSNAIKFTDRGEVKVTVTSRASCVTSQKNNPPGPGGGLTTHDPRPTTDFLEIVVSDTGVGIPLDKLGSIFEEFVQVGGSESSVQKGTGLGLSITKRFAELLGGTIHVESEVGKGSTFTVRVPAAYG